MKKFNLKEHISKNKSTFFSSLTEGEAVYEYEEGKSKGEEIEKEKMTKGKLRSKIKEMIVSEMDVPAVEDEEYDFLKEIDDMLNEKDEDTEEQVDIEEPTGDEEIDTTVDVSTDEVDPKVKTVQDALTQAQAAAKHLGDPKLTDQIGNTITFFTRSHVVEKPKGAMAEDLNETLLLQKRAGIITETQYKQKLNEVSEDEVPLTPKVKSFINKAIADSKKDGEFENLKEADWFENELIDELIDLFPNKDYDSSSPEVMNYISQAIK